ncbi:MAG: hypothetical protein U9O59_02745 [Actinomycetota bacterium]|nr:hypothetical protein [Actinomycetota bacterium]
MMIKEKNKKESLAVNKEFKRILIMGLLALLFAAAVIFISACSVFGLEGEEGSAGDETLKVPEVDIDEREIEEIGKGEEDMKKSFEAEVDIGIIDKSARDPFKPFYTSDDEEGEEKNILKLEEVYSREEVDFVDINLNDYTYKLKVGDSLDEIYVVMAINDDSVVLQKGDEILTLIMDVPLYD